MTLSNPTRRRAARQAAFAGATLAAVLMTLSGWNLVAPGRASAAAVNAGAAQIVTPPGAGGGLPLAEGGSGTNFTFKLPSGAACAADGNNGGRWHTYMIPSSEDPATPAFAANGGLVGASVGSGGSGTFRNNIYSSTSTPVRGQAPNLGDAAVINIPTMRFSVWSNGNIPVGTYNLGIACVDLDLASARDNFWNTQLTITADGADPVGIHWTATTAATTTTTTTTSTSTTTTTTSGGSSTTTTEGDGSTTTTSTDDTTSTTNDGFTSTSDTSPDVLGSGLGGTDGTGGAGLPATGFSAVTFGVSAVLLLYLGRVAVLLGRPVKVLSRSS